MIALFIEIPKQADMEMINLARLRKYYARKELVYEENLEDIPNSIWEDAYQEIQEYEIEKVISNWWNKIDF